MMTKTRNYHIKHMYYWCVFIPISFCIYCLKPVKEYIDLNNSPTKFSFQKLNNLSFLYLDHNSLESVPPNLPESLRIIHLQVRLTVLFTISSFNDLWVFLKLFGKVTCKLQLDEYGSAIAQCSSKVLIFSQINPPAQKLRFEPAQPTAGVKSALEWNLWPLYTT